jgi:hypothetical protein
VEPVTPPIAVLDTSVLWGRSIRGELVRAIEAGRFVGVWSDWIIAELWRGLAWQWAEDRGLSDTERRAMSQSANTLMRILASRLTLISYTAERDAGPWTTLGDPDDEPVWATAVAAHASYVVSANTRDFPPNVADAAAVPRYAYFGIEYMQPDVFLGLVWPEDPADDTPEPAGAV